ncbi:MAG TPA: M56 family metallopeptidase, partial [Candidatus Limnocylindrales bacterium]|nr:M56 family metallopeptidase [Candidatus Limnocylindrales bacterium]
MSHLLYQASLAITAAVFAGLWQGVLIAGVTWLVLWSLHGLGASTRYAIWLCALGALLVVPLATASFSAQPNAQPVADAAARAGAPAEFIAAGAVTASTRERMPVNLVHAAPIRPPQSEPRQAVSSPAVAVPNRLRIAIPESAATVVALLWLLLALARLVKLMLALRQLGAIRRSASPWSSAHEYPVLVSRRVGVPLAFGFLRPAVVLPASLPGEIGAEALQTIIVHESAHLRRYDVWTNALARVAEALLTLNPAVWFVMRRLSAEREIACDDCVVARTGSGDAFAHVLAGLATRVGPRAPIAAASATGTTRSTIVTRIEQLLDAAPRQLALSRAALAAAVGSLAVVALVIESVSPVFAYASPQFIPAPAHAAAAGGNGSACPGIRRGLPVSMLATPRAAEAKFGASRVVPFTLTFDARGRTRNVTIGSAPSPAVAERVKEMLRINHFLPELRGCVAVAGTVRGAVVLGTVHTGTLSVVEPVYPNGWTAQHPASCKVPSLLHTEDPAFPASMDGIPIGSQYTASARVRVDQAGAVTNAALAGSSGHRAFDAALLAAVRGATYPLTESTGFKPVRPSGASLAWNAANGS